MSCTICNCDGCGCTDPLEIPVGQPGTSTVGDPGPPGGDGPEGPPGDDGPEGPPGADCIDYDSGWKTIPMIKDQQAHDGQTFGFSDVDGFVRPKVRIVNRCVYIQGAFEIPLSLDNNGGQLMTNKASSYTTGAKHMRVYEGTAGGGYAVTGGGPPEYKQAGALTSRVQILPTDLHCDIDVYLINTQTSILRVTRPMNAAGAMISSKSITYNSWIQSMYLRTGGKIFMSHHTDVDDSAAPSGPINNSQLHKIITRVDAGDEVQSYDNREYASGTHQWNTSYPEVGPVASGTYYPVTIDCDLSSNLGCFIVPIHTCYPIKKGVSQAAVIAAFDSIVGPVL